MSENIIQPNIPAPERGDSSTGDLAESQVGTPKVGGVSPMAKKFPLLLALSILVMAILAALSIYLFLQTRAMYTQSIASPSPTASAVALASADPTSTWLTYTNTSGNYSIKYPGHWQITNVAAGSLGNEPPSDARYIEIAPKKSNPKIGSGNIGIEEMGILPPSEEKNLSAEKVVGSLTLRCNGTFATDTKTWCWVEVPGKNKYLNIQIFKGANEEDNLLFDQILSTFKFTNNDASKPPGKCTPTYKVETNIQELTAKQNYAMECTSQRSKEKCLKIDIYNQKADDFSIPDKISDCTWQDSVSTQ